MRHRHWQKIGLRPETFQEILDAKIETSLIIKVNHVADEEYKLEMEVDKMQKDYIKLNLTFEKYKHAVAGRMHEVDFVTRQKNTRECDRR